MDLHLHHLHQHQHHQEQQTQQQQHQHFRHLNNYQHLKYQHQNRGGNLVAESHEHQDGISRHLWNDSTAVPPAYGKRARDDDSSSPTWSESGMMQSSFKRLKVMDECSSNADSLYSTITNYSMAEPPASMMAPPQVGEQQPYVYENQYHHGALPPPPTLHPHHMHHFHQQQHPEWCQEQEPTAVGAGGQNKALEPSSASSSGYLQYQSMNAMLGDLHLRRRQQPSTTGDHDYHSTYTTTTTTTTTTTFSKQHSVEHPASATSRGGSTSSSISSSTGTSTFHKKPVSLRTSSKLL